MNSPQTSTMRAKAGRRAVSWRTRAPRRRVERGVVRAIPPSDEEEGVRAVGEASRRRRRFVNTACRPVL